MRSFELLPAQHLFVYHTLIGIDLVANAMELGMKREIPDQRAEANGGVIRAQLGELPAGARPWVYEETLGSYRFAFPVLRWPVGVRS